MVIAIYSNFFENCVLGQSEPAASGQNDARLHFFFDPVE